MMGPHAPYTCPPDYLHKFVDQARELGAEIHIHLSETKGKWKTSSSNTANRRSP